MSGDTSADLSLLQQVSSTISDTFSRYGNVGMSIGVAKDGDQAFFNIGQMQIGSPSPSNETIYLISSMTKPIVAIALFILVNDKKYNISIDTPLRISDLLDLRSEFYKGINLWENPNGHVLWQSIDSVISLLCNMPNNPAWGTEDSFVNKRNYINEYFSLVGAIIKKVTNILFAKFMRQKIFEPLSMKNTSVGVNNTVRRNNTPRLTKSHSTRVEETLIALRSYGESTPTYAHIEEYVASGLFTPPRPVEVNPSEALDGTENLGLTPLAAAAGIMSTTVDILTLSSRLIVVYNSPWGTCQTELDREIASMLNYIDKSSQTCTYAAGWNRVFLPWDPRVLDPKPRWPGADGDNVRRLEAAIKERYKPTPIEAQEYSQKAWPFFQDSSSFFSSSPDLTLYHGGNMVGATSFWFLIPRQNIAVVVLCNTRGFFLDAANLTCMVLADALYHGRHQPLSSVQIQSHINTILTQSKVLAQRIVASYLFELVKYEDKLSREFPVVADNETYAASCAGTYQFCEGIFTTVSRGEGGLVFQLYGSGFWYPLRVRTRKATSSSLPSLGEKKKTVEMTFAIPISELTPTGVGGENRLDVEDFVIIFDKKDEDNGGKFGMFSWNFAKAKSTGSVHNRSSPPPVFAFKQVE